MLRLLIVVAMLAAAGACSHRDISNPYSGPIGSQPLP